MNETKSDGKIVTFYSYKGGTGRSMALANVAWILASNGNRVLTVDWDLEAPGLHRYFKPFLVDQTLTSSEGIIDLVLGYAVEALTPPEEGKPLSKDWYLPLANILRYATSLNWEFPGTGRLDFIPAGKQGPSYATRMNSFDWRNFYERLGGRAFLEAVKNTMRDEYDYIFIDSRTGVSDTSGICTVQMPDILVVCFTLNDQSIEGAAAVAASVREQRGVDELAILPVPMRIENAEKAKLEIRKEYAKEKFAMFPEHIPTSLLEQYWEDVQFFYVPYYAYEEVLAAFGDKPREKNTILGSAELLASYLTQGAVDRLGSLPESRRLQVKAQYEESPIGMNVRRPSDVSQMNIGADQGRSRYLPTYQFDLFLSYSHSDSAWAAKLAELIESEDWQGRKLRVFLPSRDIRPGQSLVRKIEEAGTESRRLGFVMSPESVTETWIEIEGLLKLHGSSLHKDGRLIPLYRHTCVIPNPLRPLVYIDFRDDSKFQESYERLLAVVRNEPLPEPSEPPVILLSPSIPIPPITGFVGRRDRDGRDMLGKLKEELAPRANQLVTLWGPGGVGKTTLAAEVARDVAETFGQRVIWISADGRPEFSLNALLDDILIQLGHSDLRKLAPESKRDQARELVMMAPTLIVLDNFETIAPEEATRCSEWLAQSGLCSALITTRQHIETARHNIAMSSMRLEEAHELLQRLISQAHDPTAFVSVDREQLIKTAEGNPLVVMWIVSQIDLAQDADEVLNELKHGAGSAAERVFDRSFTLNQLDNGGRAVLLALSLFVPSATRRALGDVAGLGKEKDKKRFREAVRTLSALWLLRSAEAGERLSIEGLTRELARARLNRDPRSKSFARRYVSRFLSYVEANQKITPSNLNSIEAEKDNILNAIDIASEMKDATSVMRICSAIEQFLYLRGYWDEAVRRGEQALNTARKSGIELEVARFAHDVAIIHQSRGELTQALQLYDESLVIGKNLGDAAGIAATLHQLGELAQNQGRVEEARNLYSESLKIKKRLDNQHGIAVTLHHLGILAQDQGKLHEARQLYNESLALKKSLGNQPGIAVTLHQLGILAQDQGELEEARRLYNESFEIEKRLGDQGGIAITLQQLGILAQDQGELEEARRLYDESLLIHKRLGSQLGIATVLYRLGLLSEQRGNKYDATHLIRESVDIFERLRSPFAETAKKTLTSLETGNNLN